MIRALSVVVMEHMKDHEAMALVLQEQEQEQALDKAAGEREEPLLTKRALVQRIGRLDSETRWLRLDMAELEDVADGQAPTWQRLRTERNILAGQNRLLRRKMGTMETEITGPFEPDYCEEEATMNFQHDDDDEPQGEDTGNEGEADSEDHLAAGDTTCWDGETTDGIVRFMCCAPETVRPGMRRLWRLALLKARLAFAQYSSDRPVSMNGLRYGEDLRLAGALTCLAGEYWTNTLHEMWGLPSRRASARWFNGFMLSRGLEPLRDGSTFVGTPEVLDTILGLLFRTPDRRFVLQFDATFLSPSVSLRANGSIGGVPPGAAGATPAPLEPCYDREQLVAVIEEATCSGRVAKCLHGLLIVPLDHVQAPIPYWLSASGRLLPVRERLSAA